MGDVVDNQNSDSRWWRAQRRNLVIRTVWPMPPSCSFDKASSSSSTTMTMATSLSSPLANEVDLIGVVFQLFISSPLAFSLHLIPSPFRPCPQPVLSNPTKLAVDRLVRGTHV